jgi:hypothetical protein
MTKGESTAMRQNEAMSMLIKGSVVGAGTALVLSAYVVLARLMIGPSYGASHGLTLWQMILLYWGGLVPAGAIAGMLWRQVHSLFSKAVVGFLAALPAFLVFSIPYYGRQELRDYFVSSTVLALLTGPAIAILVSRDRP